MLAVIAACGGADPGDGYVARDPCTPLAISIQRADPATSAPQRAGTTAALALWRGRGVTAFDPAPDPAPDTIEIEFADAAATFHGIYDPAHAQVLVNRDLTDPQAIAIVVAHELGHVFGLGHIAPEERQSLMNPGNLVTPPTEDDQRTLEARWGSCR